MPSSGYVADTFVAGEQPTTAKWNELWGNDASFNAGTGFNDAILLDRHFSDSSVQPHSLLAGTGTSWVWQSWTPAWTNMTIGNSTVVARYIQIGKVLHGSLAVTLGSTSSIAAGTVSFSLPTSRQGTPLGFETFGTVALYDNVTPITGVLQWLDASHAYVLANADSAAYGQTVGVNSTAPFTWGSPPTGKTISISFFYETA